MNHSVLKNCLSNFLLEVLSSMLEHLICILQTKNSNAVAFLNWEYATWTVKFKSSTELIFLLKFKHAHRTAQTE